MRDAPDGDFAAALAETAGDAGEEAKGRDARTEKSDDVVRFLRAARRLEAREMRARQDGDVPSPPAGTAEEPADEPRLKVVGRGVETEGVRKVAAKEAAETVADAAKPEAVAPNTAAREVLAVLGVDLTARPERVASAPEMAVSMRMAAGVRNIDMDADRAGKTGEPDLGDQTEAEVLTVRVISQEKHFAPAGVETQRWKGVLSLREDAHAPSIPAFEKRVAEPNNELRDRPTPPTAQARPVEMAAPVAQMTPTPGGVMPGAVGIQIADRVQQALGTPAESSAPPPPAGANVEGDTRQVFAPAIRTIKLQLNPHSLGVVTIVLSGNDDGLRIDLAAELVDTVTQVENDRGVLAARLNGAGYAVTEVSVSRLGGQAMDGDNRDQGARQGTQEQLAGNASREGGQNGRGFGGHAPHSDGTMAPRSAADAPSIGGVSYAGRLRSV